MGKKNCGHGSTNLLRGSEVKSWRRDNDPRMTTTTRGQRPTLSNDPPNQQAALQKAKLGEVSRARRLPTSCSRECGPRSVLEVFEICSQGCITGSAWLHTGEHLKILLDDNEAVELVAVDITLRCVLSSSGDPNPGTADVDGLVLLRAQEDKETTYPELATSGRCRFVVLAMETGGRWSEEAVDFVRQWDCAKAREVPPYMSFSAA